MINAFSYKSCRILNAFITFLVSLWAFSPVFGLEITVEQKAVVKGDTVKLGDIASFEPMDDTRVSRLKGIEISSSPAAGSDSRINKNLMISKMNPYISGDSDILVRLPENMTVQRTAQYLSSQRVEEIFTDYVKENSGWPEDRIGFEGINTPGTIALPEGRLSWEVQERGKRDLIGNVALTIAFSIDDKEVKKIVVSGRVGVKGDVIRASDKIERGRIITELDIKLVNDNSLHYRKDFIAGKEEIIGKRALRTIQADQEILAGMVAIPPPIKKGDKVIISAENAQLKITTTGEALQDGQPGDQVEVLNIQSGRKIIAKVKGSGLVEVFF